MLEEWLVRASGRPIDIYFEIKDPLPAPWDTLMFLEQTRTGTQLTTVPMINLLANHSAQWRCIEFYIPSTWYSFFTSSTEPSIIMADNAEPSASTKAPLELPLLKSASLYRTDKVVTKEPVVDLALAPSLRALSLSHFRMSSVFFEKANFEHIRTLTFDSVYDVNLDFLLPRLPNLHEATFRYTRCFGTRNIRHRKLCRFEVHASEATQLYHCLSKLILPRLKFLSVFVGATMHYSDIFTLPFSDSHLTSLSMTCRITEDLDLIKVLSFLGCLREFYVRSLPGLNIRGRSVDETGLSNTFFNALHPDENPSYLPLLEVLSYEGNLLVQGIDFLEPFIIRSRMRPHGGSSGTYTNLEKIAVLRKVKIQADQLSDLGLSSIAEYPDSQYAWDILRMIAAGVLELISVDGEFWQ
jgi:hypothetical protein